MTISGFSIWHVAGNYWATPLDKLWNAGREDIEELSQGIREAASKIYRRPAADLELKEALLMLFVGQDAESWEDGWTFRDAFKEAFEGWETTPFNQLRSFAMIFYRSAGMPALLDYSMDTIEGTPGLDSVAALDPYNSAFFDYWEYRQQLAGMGGASDLAKMATAHILSLSHEEAFSRAATAFDIADESIQPLQVVQAMPEGQDYDSMTAMQKDSYWAFVWTAEFVQVFRSHGATTRIYNKRHERLLEIIAEELAAEHEGGNITFKGLTPEQLEEAGWDFETQTPTDTPAGELYRKAIDRLRAEVEGEAEPAKESLINLCESTFLPMVNGYPTSDFMRMSARRLKPDLEGKVTYTRDGRTITAENFSEAISALGTSAKKIVDVGIAYITKTNYFRTNSDFINPTAVIDLMDFWRAQGKKVDAQKMPTPEAQKKEDKRAAELIKQLREELNADLAALAKVSWDGKGTGKNKDLRAHFYFISSYYPARGKQMRINFDADMARYLINSYQMQWPPALLLHDNRDGNGYAVGWKLALHNSMDSNAAAGTNNTISVKSLLSAAPDIITFEELQAKGRRDWKKQIKEKLEAALDKNITVAPVLARWEYRDPATGQTYTPKTASALLWEDYSRFMIDFVMLNEPDQKERRAARAAEKAAKLAEMEERRKNSPPKPKRKRGRPKKKTSASKAGGSASVQK